MSSPSTQTGGTDPSKPELPWAFIDCPTDTLIILISHMLNLLIEHNDQVVLTPDALTRFHSRAAPGISVIEYLRRIVKYTNMEKIPLLSLLAYIDLTCAHLPTFTLSTLTVHRFLIAGVCAGSKAQCDVFCTNSHYAKVGGIKVGELNSLEREFLRVTQWNLCCNADLLQRYYTSLIRSHGGYNQAPSPDVIPFRAFPRSLSKPRAADDDAEEDMPGDAEGEAGEEADDAGEDEGMEGSDADRPPEELGEEAEKIKRRRKSVDNVLGVGIEVDQDGQIQRRGRRRKESQEAMDVDPSESALSIAATQGLPAIVTPSSQLSSDTAISPTLSTRSRGDAPISPASSSIPSSSRSSFGGSRGRPSLTNLNGSGRPAAAVVDKRHAGSTGLSTPDVLGGAVMGVSPPNIARGELPPLGAVVRDPSVQEEPESYHAEPTETVETGDNHMDGRSTGRHPQNGSSSTGSHGHHGKILKNIVGAFRKKSSGPSAPAPAHEIPQPGQRPHQPLPSRPLSTNIAPSGAGDRSSSAMPRYSNTPASPRDSAQMTKSPGMAKNVTPRIRTREERSVDSLRDRNGVGVGAGME